MCPQTTSSLINCCRSKQNVPTGYLYGLRVFTFKLIKDKSSNQSVDPCLLLPLASHLWLEIYDR
jgi:hypothetical protein